MGKRHSLCYLTVPFATLQWELDSEGGWGCCGVAACQRPRVLTGHYGGLGARSREGSWRPSFMSLPHSGPTKPQDSCDHIVSNTEPHSLCPSAQRATGHSTAWCLQDGFAPHPGQGLGPAFRQHPTQQCRRGSDQGPRVLCAAPWHLSWWLSSHSQASVLDVGCQPACDTQAVGLHLHHALLPPAGSPLSTLPPP